MSFTIIHTQLWMSLPIEVREHIAKVFNLERNGIREIRDQTVISDGFKQEDLLRITAGKMMNYVGSEESFPRLWELTIAKAKYELNPPATFVGVPVNAPSDEAIIAPTVEVLPVEKTTHAKTKKSK